MAGPDPPLFQYMIPKDWIKSVIGFSKIWKKHYDIDEKISTGHLLMTARQNSESGRVFSFSDNQGATWQPSFTGFISTQVMEAVERYTQA